MPDGSNLRLPQDVAPPDSVVTSWELSKLLLIKENDAENPVLIWCCDRRPLLVERPLRANDLSIRIVEGRYVSERNIAWYLLLKRDAQDRVYEQVLRGIACRAERGTLDLVHLPSAQAMRKTRVGGRRKKQTISHPE